jgi:hypothetical protein
MHRLPHLPVIKDLLADFSAFYAQYAAIQPWLRGARIGGVAGAFSPRRVPSSARRVIRGAVVALPPRRGSCDVRESSARGSVVVSHAEGCPSLLRSRPLALLLRGKTGFKAVAEYLVAWHVTARESER